MHRDIARQSADGYDRQQRPEGARALFQNYFVVCDETTWCV